MVRNGTKDCLVTEQLPFPIVARIVRVMVLGGDVSRAEDGLSQAAGSGSPPTTEFPCDPGAHQEVPRRPRVAPSPVSSSS